MHLSSNRSQMTSKCGKNKKVAHETIASSLVFYVITKLLQIEQSFFLSKYFSESRPSLTLANAKKAIWRNDIYYCQSHWLLWVAKNCDWSRKITPPSNTGKVESVFVFRAAQWAEKLGCCLEYCRSWEIHSENLRLHSTWGPLDSCFERKGALVTVEICFLCDRWFSV